MIVELKQGITLHNMPYIPSKNDLSIIMDPSHASDQSSFMNKFIKSGLLRILPCT